MKSKPKITGCKRCLHIMNLGSNSHVPYVTEYIATPIGTRFDLPTELTLALNLVSVFVFKVNFL